ASCTRTPRGWQSADSSSNACATSSRLRSVIRERVASGTGESATKSMLSSRIFSSGASMLLRLVGADAGFSGGRRQFVQGISQALAAGHADTRGGVQVDAKLL